jgi:cation transporter-like permease
LFLAGFTHPAAPFEQAAAIFAIAIVDVVAVVSILFVVAVVAGIHFYKKGEDPNNFLIPITTSIADFGNMLLLAALVMMFF